jgi:Regulatory subunit of type II PKA R-subunit
VQIRVPPQLAEVLKDYTKEVIRRQPKDLIEFSAFYFANLANIIPAHNNFPVPMIQQIHEVYQAVAGSAATRTCDVRSRTLPSCTTSCHTVAALSVAWLQTCSIGVCSQAATLRQGLKAPQLRRHAPADTTTFSNLIGARQARARVHRWRQRSAK